MQQLLTFVLDHEAEDAALFASWKIDALKCKCRHEYPSSFACLG